LGFYSRGEEGAQVWEDTSGEFHELNPRTISNALGEQLTDTPKDENGENMITVLFGQFVNHDLERNAVIDEFEQIFDFIYFDTNDPICFVPIGGGRPLTESRCPDPASVRFRQSAGTLIDDEFEVRNEATSYLDLDSVYGRDDTVVDILREGEGGRLKEETYSGTAFRFLPYSIEKLPPSRGTTGLPADTLHLRQPDDQIPSAGDNRVANNVSLFLFHTLFLREHNRIALQISESNPEMDDETLFQEARRLNIAQYQNIVLYEYLTSLLGPYFEEVVGQYDKYDKKIDPTTSILFATVAYRFGHSALSGYAPRDECGDISTLVLPPFLPPGSNLPSLGQAGGPFTPPIQVVIANGFENIIRGLILTQTNRVDLQYVDEIRQIPVSTGVIDIFALDIMRGRINQVPNYARLVMALGDDRGIYSSPDCPSSLKTDLNQTDPVSCFIKITAKDIENPTDEEQQSAEDLLGAFGKVLHVDSIIGLLAEAHMPGISFGKSLLILIADQFKRSRDGDRFWFENGKQFSENQLMEIKSTSMKDLFVRNFDIEILPENVFANGDLLNSTITSC